MKVFPLKSTSIINAANLALSGFETTNENQPDPNNAKLPAD